MVFEQGRLFCVSLVCSIIALGVLCLASCSVTTKPKTHTIKELTNAIKDNTQILIIGEPNGPQIVITPELSARVLGASLDGENGKNLFWVDKTILDRTYWSKKPYFWNAGGYRTWLAPEDLFFLNDKKEWFVPSSLDPAPYRMIEQTPISVTFEADVNLKTNTGKFYKITLSRRLSLLSECPFEIGSLPAGVKYVGIDLVHSLTNRMEEVIGVDLPYVCLWNMLQVNPAGTTLVPLVDGYEPQKAFRDYFNPLGDRLKVSNSIISVKIDGQYRSKIGVRPDACKSGIAFLRDNRDNTGVLYVMLFPIDTAGIYVDKPWGTESDYGDAIELYNDDGKMGGFTEIECLGPAKMLGRGETQSHHAFLHIFGGPVEELKKIGSTLMNTDLSKAVYF